MEGIKRLKEFTTNRLGQTAGNYLIFCFRLFFGQLQELSCGFDFLSVSDEVHDLFHDLLASASPVSLSDTHQRVSKIPSATIPSFYHTISP